MLDRQLDPLNEIRCERIFEDHASGARLIGRASTLYHYLHADGALKEPGRRLLQA